MKKSMYSKKALIIIAILAAIAPVWNYSCRIGYVFVDAIIFNGFNTVMLSLMVFNAVFMQAMAYLATKGRYVFRYKLIKKLYTVCAYATGVYLILDLLYVILSPSDINVYWYYFLDMLPYLVVIYGALFLSLIFPGIHGDYKKPVAAVLIFSLLLGLSISAFNLFVFRFSSEPVVLDTGENYHIIWATNDEGTGYVEYTAAGESKVVYDLENGRKTVSKIHKVEIPYEELNNNSYKVYSSRVKDEIAYGGHLGRTISSKTYAFTGGDKEDMTIWSFSDWHCKTGWAEDAAENLVYEPDLVLLMGDYVNAMYREEDIAEFILSPAAKITNSSCPVIFVRGNHETRGEYAGPLAAYLGMDSFYYEVIRGDYRFIILDSAEDKMDSHPEYGGLADFEAYREEETAWLRTLQPGSSEYTVALCHDFSFAEDVNEDIADAWESELIRLNIDIMVSGHSHDSVILDDHPFPTVLDGGKTKKKINGINRSVYIASVFSFNSGNFTVISYDNKGNKYLDTTLALD